MTLVLPQTDTTELKQLNVSHVMLTLEEVSNDFEFLATAFKNMRFAMVISSMVG